MLHRIDNMYLKTNEVHCWEAAVVSILFTRSAHLSVTVILGVSFVYWKCNPYSTIGIVMSYAIWFHTGRNIYREICANSTTIRWFVKWIDFSTFPFKDTLMIRLYETFTICRRDWVATSLAFQYIVPLEFSNEMHFTSHTDILNRHI